MLSLYNITCMNIMMELITSWWIASYRAKLTICYVFEASIQCILIVFPLLLSTPTKATCCTQLTQHYPLTTLSLPPSNSWRTVCFLWGLPWSLIDVKGITLLKKTVCPFPICFSSPQLLSWKWDLISYTPPGLHAVFFFLASVTQILFIHAVKIIVSSYVQLPYCVL